MFCLTLVRWISFHLALLIHLGSLHWRGVLEGWALSKILAYDWINHLSVIDVPNTVGRRAKTSFPPTKAFRAVLWCSFKERIFARLDNTDKIAASMLTLASSMRAAIVVWIKTVASPLRHIYKKPARRSWLALPLNLVPRSRLTGAIPDGWVELGGTIFIWRESGYQCSAPIFNNLILTLLLHITFNLEVITFSISVLHSEFKLTHFYFHITFCIVNHILISEEHSLLFSFHISFQYFNITGIFNAMLAVSTDVRFRSLWNVECD